MVLEEPETLATADEVVQQFDELSGTRDRMITARQQVKALTPIREHRATIDEAKTRLRVIDDVGSFSDDSSPAALWRHERQARPAPRGRGRPARRHRRAKERGAGDDRPGRGGGVRARGGRGRPCAPPAATGWTPRCARSAGVEQRLADVERARDRLDRALDTLGADRVDRGGLRRAGRAAHGSSPTPTPEEGRQNRFAEAMTERRDAERDLTGLQTEVKAVQTRGATSRPTCTPPAPRWPTPPDSPRTTCPSSVS